MIMNDLQYIQLMNDIFTNYTFRDDVNLYGESSDNALNAIKEHMELEEYFDVEETVSNAYSEIAFNGFCAGFRHAIVLLMGSSDVAPVQLLTGDSSSLSQIGGA